MEMFLAFLASSIPLGVPLLYGSVGEIITEKSGHLNLGIPGIMYVGAISGVIGSFLYEMSCGNVKENMVPALAILIPLLCAIIGAVLMGLIYSFLTVTLRANQNVTGLALTTFGIGIGNFFGGSLVKLVDRVYHNVEFYRKKMQALGLEPGDINGIEDLHKLPFTTKNDLRDTYPFGLFAVPQSQIVRVHASSGTTGKATVVGYTRKDIEIWSECVARAFSQAGLTRDDVIQVAYGYGLFTANNLLLLHFRGNHIGFARCAIVRACNRGES